MTQVCKPVWVNGRGMHGYRYGSTKLYPSTYPYPWQRVAGYLLMNCHTWWRIISAPTTTVETSAISMWRGECHFDMKRRAQGAPTTFHFILYSYFESTEHLFNMKRRFTPPLRTILLISTHWGGSNPPLCVVLLFRRVEEGLPFLFVSFFSFWRGEEGLTLLFMSFFPF